MKLKSLVTTLLLIMCFACNTSEKKEEFSFPNQGVLNTKFPKPIGFINDFDNIFSDEQEANLLKLVTDHEAETTNQISVVTLTDIGTYEDLQQYSFDLANAWGIGQKDKNNGILIALYVKEKNIWIHNGDDIIQKLSDLETQSIITTFMVPEFKKDDYYTGLENGIHYIVTKLSQDKKN